MKASCFLSSLAASIMAVTGLQAGGMGPGAGISIGSAGGGAAISGGHAAAVSTGGAHISAAPVGHAAISGPRAAIATSHSTAPHYLPGGFTPNIFPNSSMTRAGASRGVGNPAFAQTGAFPARVAPTAPAARAHNAWTDAAADDRTVGTHLYPDATHDALGNPYPGTGRGDHGARGSYQRPFRFHGRGYYGPYVYGYPGVFAGGYGPYAYGDTAGIADAANGDVAVPIAPDTMAESNQPSPEAQNELSRPYASAQAMLPAGDSTVNPPDQSVQPGNGPDSLVEAVQAELSRRGYFGGKIDAIYNDATHTAIQRFQTDQKLPASGRINEATLHALQLD